MGSGHFLRAAFDMFVAMYRERRPELSAKEIADTILSQHLYGVDLDPRAAQLSVLTLYLRAWELVHDEQRRMRKPTTDIYIPPVMNLAATPSGLTKGALERHLQRMPEDRIFKSLLEDVFTGLEQADILGSLLRPREYLDNAIAELVKPRNLELETDWATIERLQVIQKLAVDDPDRLREQLLETIANSFHIEAGNTEDISVALFGLEAEQGVRLLQVLARQYAVVVTNPPYLGSAYMDNLLKKYITNHYPSGKRDVYAAFILCCIELCKPNGRVAMVTMQSWMFLRHYTEIRVIHGEHSKDKHKKNEFKGLLRETSIELLAHLDAHAFEEISGEVVKNVMFTLKNCVPDDKHRIVAFRLAGLKSPKQKKLQLQRINKSNNITTILNQYDFIAIKSSPLVYYLNEELITILTQGKKLDTVADVRQGLATADDDRFIRYTWEIPITYDRWVALTKGGGYSRWFGLNWYHVDWELAGRRMKLSGKSVFRNVYAYFSPGWSYSLICSGNLSLRRFDIPGCIGHKGPGIYTQDQSLVAVMQSRVLSCILRAISPQLAFEVATITQSPLPKTGDGVLISLASLAEAFKRRIVSNNCTERNFAPTIHNLEYYSVACWLHTTEGFTEHVVCRCYNLSERTIRLICDETGTPAAWHPLIADYDTIPALPNNLYLPGQPQELFDYLASRKRITLSDTEFKRIKANLKALYEAGPKAKGVEQEESEEHVEKSEGEEELTSSAHIPIPTETFLEELSVKMELHPISVYWLLEELRSEGVRCKPEEKRQLEDRLSVLVLRLLGYRWPRQLEAGEPVPLWAEQYGIIPLVSGTGHPTLAERIRERLYHEGGALAVQQINVLLQELTGYDLEQWLRRSFFSNHIRQFKQRPIAWHLASTPTKNASATGKSAPKKKRGSTSRQPAFECLLYYHACGKGALARIRTQYVEPLLNAERYKIEHYHTSKEEEAKTHNVSPTDNQPDDPPEITFAKECIRELEDFVLRLQRVEGTGFVSPELQQILALEPLDRWCGDGYNTPTSHDAWLRHEQEWRVDINDGVRVNIAPLQLAGVLTSDVLKPTDAKKALSDRVHWRADERRWVRGGKLPRCGWMADTVEASEAWLEQQGAQQADTPQQMELL